MEIPLYKDILIIFGLAMAVLLICHRLRLPSIVGFLLTGILVGPHGLSLIDAVQEVRILAEIGVVLLLFTIGIEFSMESLLRIKRSVFLGGALQVLGTILLAFLICKELGLASGRALFIGFLVSLSSTAIVLKLLQERAEIESPHGQASLAILIFQDIIVVPMMLLIPFLAGAADKGQGSLLIPLLKGAGIIFLVLAGAKWIVPKILYQIARTRSRELFLLSILMLCFLVAFLTHSLGLSLALGAFLAGLVISETEFSHETLSNIIPFRDVFTSFFFVSIGMLMNVKYLAYQLGQVVLTASAVMTLKCIVVCVVILILGFPIRIGILGALALCQVGEFSFVLFVKGTEFGLLEERFYQVFLNVSVLTMGITPFAIKFAPRLVDAVLSLPLPKKLGTGFSWGISSVSTKQKQRLRDHSIIVGFGFNGKNVARASKISGIPYVIIEMNPETVRRERERGEPIFYGDATHDAVLENACIGSARILVVVISDPMATRKLTEIARKKNPKAYIIVRTRFISEMQPLYKLGANEVIPEEFETSIEIFSRVLSKYLIPRDEIEQLITEARADGYRMFRSLSRDLTSFSDLKMQLPDVDIATFRVIEDSLIAGSSLSQIGLRKKYGVTLLAIRRNEQVLSNPDGDTTVLAGDILILLGRPTKLSEAASIFRDVEKNSGKGDGNTPGTGSYTLST